MSERIIKWGFIGCGEVTKYKSGPAFQKIENSEVVAVMSRNGDKAKTYAKERGIPKWYDDAQELIDDEEVNAVYIATPPSSHATYAIMSMKAWAMPSSSAGAAMPFLICRCMCSVIRREARWAISA